MLWPAWKTEPMRTIYVDHSRRMPPELKEELARLVARLRNSAAGVPPGDNGSGDALPLFSFESLKTRPVWRNSPKANSAAGSE